MTPRLPYLWARTYRALLHPGAGGLELTISEHTPQWAVSEIQRRHGVLPINKVSDVALEPLLMSAYAQTGDAASIVDAAAHEIDLDRLLQDMPAIEDLLETSDDAPIIRMINALFTQAARDGASDIHIEPFETHSVVRYRVDGTLRDIVRPRRALHNALVSRIKVMASLDIAEKRLPQDGRIALRVGGRPIDVRVATLPTGHGERVSLRLLDKQAGRLQLERLG
ncbi:GspE/PulE family protein, partial [Allopusillimonas soli]